MKKLIWGLLGLLVCVLMLSGQTFMPLKQECPQADVAPVDAAMQFYQQRSNYFLTERQQVGTYSKKYETLVNAIYPPTFWEDKILCVPPYDVEGILYTLQMRDIYEALSKQKPLDVAELAQKALVQAVLNTRDKDVAHVVPFYSKEGDVWYTAFALIGQYEQMMYYDVKYGDLEEAYDKYKAAKKAHDAEMVKHYEKHYDFTPVEQKMDMKVFSNRIQDIKDFASGFSNQTYSFLSKVIVPLQAVAVPGADVAAYLNEHLSEYGLPVGLTPGALKVVIIANTKSPQEYFAQAEQLNPSLSQKLTKASKGLFRVAHRQGKISDVEALVGLFDYMMPSTYIEMLNNWSEGKATHQQVIESLAEALAAEDLTKRLAQIANDLFEVERIFAFPTTSVSEDVIEKNWQKLATNSHFDTFMIARLAADNIMKSGKTKYQTNAIFNMQLKNRKVEAAKINSQILLTAVDFVPFVGIGELLVGGEISSKTARAQKETALMAKRELTGLAKPGSKTAVTKGGKTGANTMATKISEKGTAGNYGRTSEKSGKNYIANKQAKRAQKAAQVVPKHAEELVADLEKTFGTNNTGVNGLMAWIKSDRKGEEAAKALEKAKEGLGHSHKEFEKYIDWCFKNSVCLDRRTNELFEANKYIKSLQNKGLKCQNVPYLTSRGWATETHLEKSPKSMVRSFLDQMGAGRNSSAYGIGQNSHLYKEGTVVFDSEQSAQRALRPVAAQQRKVMKDILDKEGVTCRQYVRLGEHEVGNGIAKDHVHLETILSDKAGNMVFTWSVTFRADIKNREALVGKIIELTK